MSAAQNLADLLRVVERVRDEELPPEVATRAWQSYLRSVAADAEDLCGDPEVTAMLGRLKECGKGWPGRVQTIKDTMREAKPAPGPRMASPNEGVHPDACWADLDVTERGGVSKTVRNAAIVFEKDKRWAGRIRKNGFTGETELDGEPVTDEDGTGAMMWLDENYGLVLPTARVDEAMRFVATQAEYHPVRDYLNGLQWDGRGRIEALLGEYFGADPGRGNRLLEVLSARFMLSCVARVMKPGCKVDTVLVLKGDQGKGKSTAVEALAGTSWFGDTDLDPQNKDAYQQIQGIWIYEVGEIEKWNNRRDQATIKSFLSSRRDRYRPSYGRYLVNQKRQVVFVGTTNRDTFLADDTGSRRYWPVTVGELDVAGIREDRDQLWAEAVHRFRAGEQWHLTREEAATLDEASEEYREVDPWEESVAKWLTGDSMGTRTGFQMLDVMRVLELDARSQTSATVRRIGIILRKLGYAKRREQRGGSRVYTWHLDE